LIGILSFFLQQATFLELGLWMRYSWFASRVQVLSEQIMFAYFGRFKLYNQGEEEISMKKGRG
jgi:hypothetical protein